MPHRTARKLLVTVSLIAGTALALTGCSGGSGGSDSSKVLTVQVQTGQEAEINSFIKVFKSQHPGITVKTVTVGQTAKNGSNVQVITSSNAPDVALVPTNSQAYSGLTRGKQLVPLTDVWKKSDLASRYGKTLSTTLQVGGTPYVVSYDSTLYNVVYYNEALFQQAGITAPTDHRIASMADLESMTQKLKAIGKQGLSIGPGDGFQAAWLIDAFLPTAATSKQLDNYLTSWTSSKVPLTAKYTDKPFVDTIGRIQDMAKAGVFQNGYLGQNVAQSEANFVQQDTGMLLDGSYTTGVLKKDGVTFDYDWMLLPPMSAGKKTQVSQYNGNAYGIPTRAKNPTAAKQFLQSIMSTKAQSGVLPLGYLPAVNDVPKSAQADTPKQVQELLADQAANGGQPGWTSVAPGGLAQQLVDPKLQELWNGNGSPEAIGQSVESELTKLRAQKSGS